MRRFLVIFLVVTCLVTLGAAQSAVTSTPSGRFSVSSRGKDAREVLYDLFTQAKKQFVLDPVARMELFLNVDDLSFDEALQTVLDQSMLRFELKNSVYYLSKKTILNTTAGNSTPPTKGTDGGVSAPNHLPQPSDIDPGQGGEGEHPLSTSGKLTDNDLRRHLTTRFNLVDIRALFSEFSKQTGVTIEVDENVPKYQVKAFLLDTSLKFALDTVTKKAKLRYTRTDNHTILVSR